MFVDLSNCARLVPDDDQVLKDPTRMIHINNIKLLHRKSFVVCHPLLCYLPHKLLKNMYWLRNYTFLKLWVDPKCKDLNDYWLGYFIKYSFKSSR